MNRKYFEIQLALEGLQIDNRNRIKKLDVNHFDIEKEVDKRIPQVIALQIDNSISVFYSELLNISVINTLEKLNKGDFINDTSKVTKILNCEVGNYVTYIFPKSFNIDSNDIVEFKNSDDIKLKEFDESFYRVFPKAFAVMKDNKVVSCCVSSRESNNAGEAWVYTLPEYRKKGYGTTVVKVWANDLIKNKKVPFYSHEKNNICSKLLAEKLELRKVFETKVYE
ncbi:MAG TPA: GNAT family N-acetyltransferase [Bacilli bacterium]|nr:GNAT family N-acetyltransferase [Bacilli bacterium]